MFISRNSNLRDLPWAYGRKTKLVRVLEIVVDVGRASLIKR